MDDIARTILAMVSLLVFVEFLHIGYLVAKIRKNTMVISKQLENLAAQLPGPEKTL